MALFESKQRQSQLSNLPRAFLPDQGRQRQVCDLFFRHSRRSAGQFTPRRHPATSISLPLFPICLQIQNLPKFQLTCPSPELDQRVHLLPQQPLLPLHNWDCGVLLSQRISKLGRKQLLLLWILLLKNLSRCPQLQQCKLCHHQFQFGEQQPFQWIFLHYIF